METSMHDLDSLRARIERLERENRRFRLGGLALIVAACAAALMGQAQPARTIEAERFVLRNASGKIAAELATPRGSPALRFLAPNGEVDAVLDPHLFVMYEKQTPVAQLDRTGLYIRDDRGTAVIALGGWSELGMSAPTPSLRLADADGNSAVMGSVSISATKSGESHQTPAASMVLLAKDGKILWSAP